MTNNVLLFLHTAAQGGALTWMRDLNQGVHWTEAITGSLAVLLYAVLVLRLRAPRS